MAAGSQILTICLCRGESVEDPLLVVVVIVMVVNGVFRCSGVQLFSADQASINEQFFEGCDPSGIVARWVVVLFCCRDFRSQLGTERTPFVEVFFVECNGKAESARFPGGLKNEFSIFSGQGVFCFHGSDIFVGFLRHSGLTLRAIRFWRRRSLSRV